MAIVNLTPHTINVLGDNPQNFPPSGTVARCAVKRQQVGTVDGVPVNRTVYGDVTGLPAPQPGTYYIVSALVAQAVPDRTDVLITDDAVRDDAGRIIGCRALATINGFGFIAASTNSGGFGRPLQLDAGSMTTPAQVALAAAVMAAAVRDRNPDADHTPLADVAASHRQVLTDLPDGFTVDSPTYCLSVGYNGKRPIYLVAGDGVYTLAVGTHFGRQSTFRLVTTVYDAVNLDGRMLDKATISRILAAAR
jgi:hypothetical protein